MAVKLGRVLAFLLSRSRIEEAVKFLGRGVVMGSGSRSILAEL
jgi:hypothetical protein